MSLAFSMLKLKEEKEAVKHKRIRNIKYFLALEPAVAVRAAPGRDAPRSGTWNTAASPPGFSPRRVAAATGIQARRGLRRHRAAAGLWPAVARSIRGEPRVVVRREISHLRRGTRDPDAPPR